MTTNTTTNGAVAKFQPRTLSAEDAAKITDALEIMHSVVSGKEYSTSKGEPEELPSFASCGYAELSAVVVRAINAIDRTSKVATNAEAKAFRTKIDALLATAREKGIASRNEALKLSEETRAMLGLTVPTSVNVPLSSLASAFAENCAPETMVKQLHSAGICLAKGNHKFPMVKVELLTSAPPVPPNRVQK